MRINAVDLRQLRYFVCVAEELHFGRAAKRLNMSQPPLSQQIKALEDHLGVQLFRRTQRHVELTSSGTYLLPEARRLLQDVGRIAEQAHQAAFGQTGHIRIGVHFSAPFHPMTGKILKTFHQKYPHVKVDLALHEVDNILQLADLASARLDLALIWLDEEFQYDDLIRLDLARDELEVVVPTHHPLAKKKIISIADIANEPFIAQPRYAGTQRYEGIMEAFAQIKAEPKIVYEVLAMPLVMNMVAAGQGVSLLPSFLKTIPMEGILFRPLDLGRKRIPYMTYNLIAPRRSLNPAADNFVEHARQLIKPKRQ